MKSFKLQTTSKKENYPYLDSGKINKNTKVKCYQSFFIFYIPFKYFYSSSL